MRYVILVFSFLSSFLPDWLRADPLDEMFSRQGISVTRQPLAGVDGYVINLFEESEGNRNHFDSRDGQLIRFLVMHYTACSVGDTLKIFTANQPDNRVSAHYVITEREAGGIPAGVPIHVVSEDNRAWHAGISRWRGVQNLNASSIGIENVNKGFIRDEAGRLIWYPFDGQQARTLGLLTRDIVERHSINPRNVVGHADIAPTRKQDPGILFPWQRLYEEFEVGAWLTSAELDPDYITSHYSARDSLPQGMSVEFLLAHLEQYGYHLPSGKEGLLSPENMPVVTAFQAHFSKNQRPELYNSEPDREDMFWSWGLYAKYGQES